MSGIARNDWSQSAQIWHMVAPPYCPSPEDGRLMLELARPALESQKNGSARVLVLGVTPAIIALDWPANAELVAVDADQIMIETVWRPHPNLPSRAMLGDWTALPFDDASFALVVGDCSFNALPTAEAYRAVAAEVGRLLAPGGALVLRAFMPTPNFISPEKVVQRALSGAYANTRDFHYALTLAAAAGRHSVRLIDVMPIYNRLIPDRDILAKQTGWTRADIDRCDIVFNQSIQLTYPPFDSFQEWIGAHFMCDARRQADYPSAPFCPTLRLRHV